MTKFLHISIFLLISTMSLVAQSFTLKGTVKDSNGETLIGATIVDSDFPSIGAVTDYDGNYSLVVDAKGRSMVTIQTSYIGFRTILKEVETVDQVHHFVMAADALALDEVVVTGVVNPRSKLESSVSISTLNANEIALSTPRTTAEIFRSIPGIRSESSGGDGNTNITVRGVPISAGGSKYLQLQEDGLPLLMYGDIAFGTADIFLRADQTVKRIEAIRGGSASTQATNSPAGIINFISKTGAQEGGSVATTLGVDYSTLRTDFEYGMPINDDLSFHIGGFFRQGEGPRTAGFTANKGGQVKANITKRFGSGHARIYFKHLNDRAAAYMPMPIQVSGTNESPTWESVKGFDATNGTMHSPFLTQNLGLGPNGELRRSSVADGMHPVSQSIGAEFSFDLGDGWKIVNRGRLAFNKGRFVSPFPAEVGTADAILSYWSNGDSLNAYSLTYADDGKPFGSGYEGNGLVMRVHMFDTELNNFNNMMNDAKLSKSFGNVNFSVGYFKANQNISMSWLWNSYLTEVNGENAKMLNVMMNDSVALSQNGLYAYGVPAWGNCCQRNYDAVYDLSAPYGGIEVELNENVNLDASVRWDNAKVTGSFAGPAQTRFDVNNDGVISPTEESVSGIDNANATPVDYSYNYLSYSLGANVKLNDNQALFGRYSSGGSGKADRLLFAGLPYTGGTTLNAKDIISQLEIGYKHRFNTGGIFVTGFMANTKEEGGFEATTQKIIENDYNAIGVELEGSLDFGDFGLLGGLTYTNAQIKSENEDLNGNTPRRQPALMYNLVPQYKVGNNTIGLSIIGQSKAYAQDNNMLVMPGFMVLSGFVDVGITKGLSASLNANNLLNALGITESEEGAITENATNIVRARPIAGRSVSATVRYTF